MLDRKREVEIKIDKRERCRYNRLKDNVTLHDMYYVYQFNFNKHM